ncbi:MAG: ThiF family adenylyltransferase [Treponemataceae bacterium]|nr:MAG: ThiF family adenylyltransferase [Treponemataceae bacterium]
MTRYSRQTVFGKIGAEGQRKLLSSRAVITGAGALGTVIANNLARAGVGSIRIIDRDIVELSNLQRQTLFTEADAAAQTPKALAACEHLRAVNSEIALEPVIIDINSANINEALDGADVVVDGGDNMELRHLVNEWCVKRGVPWVYGAALQAGGASMTIVPGKTPCFRCLYPDLEMKSPLTCATGGVLNMITGAVASIESAEAVKILIGAFDALNTKLLLIDLWQNSIDYIDVARNDECPVCGMREFALLESLPASYTSRLCGQDAIQVMPGPGAAADLAGIAERLKAAGSVEANRFALKFDDGKIAFQLFSDGRAIIQRVTDEKTARSVYAEYIGL